MGGWILPIRFVVQQETLWNLQNFTSLKCARALILTLQSNYTKILLFYYKVGSCLKAPEKSQNLVSHSFVMTHKSCVFWKQANRKRHFAFSFQTGQVRNLNLIPRWNFLMLYLALLWEFNAVEAICTLVKPFNASATDTVHASGFKIPSIKNREGGLNYLQALLRFWGTE